MDTPKVFESEYRFCLILWAHLYKSTICLPGGPHNDYKRSTRTAEDGGPYNVRQGAAGVW